jgi:hypothetical protein
MFGGADFLLNIDVLKQLSLNAVGVDIGMPSLVTSR